MRFRFRGSVVLVLCACVINLPVLAVPNPALGYVLMAQYAQQDGNNALGGTNVYAGDVFETLAHGMLRISVATNQFQLLESSDAKLLGDQENATLLLTRGTAAFRSAQGTGVQIQALDVVVKPKSPVGTTAQVAIDQQKELLVSSYAASLEVSIDGNAYTLPPGHTYEVKIQDQSLQSMDAGRHPARDKRALVIFVASLTAAGFGGLFLQHQQSESPFKP